LFVRHARGVTPTAAARHFEAVVRDALECLAAGLLEARAGIEEPSTRVAVSVLPSFASRWLLPRLAGFKRKHPRIDIELTAGQELADLAHRRSKFDLALRIGLGSWRGLHAECFMEETLTPVCAPTTSCAKKTSHCARKRLCSATGCYRPASSAALLREHCLQEIDGRRSPVLWSQDLG
jgi:LysR family transcriptional regulator, glycine cleavage system transcriptional activator